MPIFQSFGLPPLKVKPVHDDNGIKIQENTFGIPDPMIAGLGATRPKLGFVHPLESSEKNVCYIFMYVM